VDSRKIRGCNHDRLCDQIRPVWRCLARALSALEV
jgi:hypothetical protein